jgi:hypothetical protein
MASELSALEDKVSRELREMVSEALGVDKIARGISKRLEQWHHEEEVELSGEWFEDAVVTMEKLGLLKYNSISDHFSWAVVTEKGKQLYERLKCVEVEIP